MSDPRGEMYHTVVQALTSEVERLRSEAEALRQHRDGHLPSCAGQDPSAQQCECGYLQGQAYRDLKAECEALREQLDIYSSASASAAVEIATLRTANARLSALAGLADEIYAHRYRDDDNEWRYWVPNGWASRYDGIKKEARDG